MPASFWLLALAALFCAVRACVDFREKRYGWCVLGAVCSLAILFAPIPTHAVKIDLPMSAAR